MYLVTLQAMLRDASARLERELQGESSAGERILDALIGGEGRAASSSSPPAQFASRRTG